ncbi:hypothetical protein SAMN05192549_106227 [Duganella sacchari]|uniref:Secreted protein n=1 Tax=Duganella sacchari TaxID=551987 RepID=A0A1M7Q5M7_9BURK|nr:hypothetical protein [Duganella sacchari]SHN25674.1 hypothetical protein SAMN05192549_106227 [Duganella sacchari]
MKLIKRWMLMAILAGGALGASAQNGPPPDGPPPEAVAACKGKAEGAKVQFTGRHGETVSGTCRKAGVVLAAMPEGGPPPPPDHQ